MMREKIILEGHTSQELTKICWQLITLSGLHNHTT